MGLITNLIEAHDGKKRQDRAEDLHKWSVIAGLPKDVATDEMRSWALKNIAGISGDALGLPKKQHGLLHSMLSGLANLNPAPGHDKPAGGEAPKNGFYTEEQAQGVRAKMAEESRGNATKDTQAAFTEQQKEGEQNFTQDQAQAEQVAKLKQARLDKLHADGTITDDEYGRASTEIQAGVKVPGMSASMLPKLGWADVSDGKGGTKRVPGRVDSTGSFTTLTGVEIEPDKISKIGTGKDPGEDVRGQLGQLEAAKKRLADPSTPVPQREADAAYVRHMELTNRGLELGNTGKALGNVGKGIANADRSLNLQADQTNAGVAVSGGSLGASVGGGASGSPSMSGAKASSGVGAAPSATKPLKATAIPAPERKAIAGGEGGSNSKVSMAQSMSDEKTMSDINFAKDVILGNIPGAGRDKLSKMRLARGTEALRKMLNLTPEKLSASLKERKGVADALMDNSKRFAAFTRLDNELTNMGELLKNARAKVPDYNAFLNKLSQHIDQQYTGDKDTAALVIAVNGYSRVYTTLVGGAWVSNALPHVSSSEQANHAIAQYMTNGQIDNVINQVHKESVAVRKGLVDTNTQLANVIGSEMGTEAKTLAGDEGGKKDKVEMKVQTSSSNPNMKRRSSDGGKTFNEYSTDGGKTWQSKSQ